MVKKLSTGGSSQEAQLASGLKERAIQECAESAKKHCKKNYIVGGPITSKGGRIICREKIKEGGDYGEDKSPRCTKGKMYMGDNGKYQMGDPMNEGCKHTGCAELKYNYDKSEEESFNSVASQLPSNLDKGKERLKSSLHDLMNRNKQPVGGRKTKRKFKKHYMWNTKGKRYMAKTYKQHIRGVKLGHTHIKPKKSKRASKKRSHSKE